MKDENKQIQEKKGDVANQKQEQEPKSNLFSSPKAKAALQGRVKAIGDKEAVLSPKENSRPAQTLAQTQETLAEQSIVTKPGELELHLQLISVGVIDPNPFFNLSTDAQGVQTDKREGLLKKLSGLFRDGQMSEFVALLRPHPKLPNRYQLVYGHLRVKAAALAGFSHIPAVVKPLSDDEMLMRLVLENQNRAEVSKVETAAQVRYLREQSGLSFKVLGELFNRPLGTVYDLYYLALAPARFTQFVHQHPQYYQAISEMVRRELPPKEQEQIWQLLQDSKAPPRQVRERVRELALVNQKQ